MMVDDMLKVAEGGIVVKGRVVCKAVAFEGISCAIHGFPALKRQG